LNVPSWRIEAVRRLELGDRGGVGHKESRIRIGSPAVRRRGPRLTRRPFISDIQRGWPSTSASPRHFDGASMTMSELIGAAPPSTLLGRDAVERIMIPAPTGPDGRRPDHRITVRQIVTPRRNVVGGSLASRLEIDRRDRVAGPPSRSRAEAHRARSP
jgi:hypothetical protein